MNHGAPGGLCTRGGSPPAPHSRIRTAWILRTTPRPPTDTPQQTYGWAAAGPARAPLLSTTFHVTERATSSRTGRF
ncbi:hypothetical protein M9458_007074, partial [Cirrhinus mrigala]